MNYKKSLASALLLLIPFGAAAADVQVVIDGKTVIFTDVPSSMWFGTYVREAAEAGIVTGYKDVYGRFTGKFGPSKNITVAEALKIAVEGAEYDEETYAMKVNSGVQHWSSKYVSVAKGEGFVVIDARVRLDRNATRAEVAALMASAFRVDITNITTGTRYTDVSGATGYSAAIEALTSNGVLTGDTDIEGQATGKFRPAEPINRAEVAKMIIAARAKFGTPGEGRMPSEADGSTQTEKNIVVYTSAGFSPTVLRVAKGTTVTFRNDTTADLWVASDPHPMHTALPGLDALSGMGQGETYSYTFDRLGTFSYHNHLKSTQKGTIIVE